MTELVKQGATGRDVTTSLIVAEVFGKEHSKVVRDIETLSCSESFNAANFGVIAYLDSRGREQKAYEITKDGFSFLVMGYTGSKAGQFKEAFINEFNKREQMLLSEEYILARSQEILRGKLQLAEQRLQQVEAERDTLQSEVKVLSPKAEYTDKVLNATGTLTTNVIAQELGMSAIKLNSELKKRGVQYKQGKQWLLTAKYRDKGLISVRTHIATNPDTGEQKTYSNTVWTEKGRKFIHSLLSLTSLS